MKNILIVEDDKQIRESLSDLLELSGYKVTEACNGKEGFNIIMDKKPDLVLCDVNMPELDGFELLGAINQRLQNQIPPIFLFLTAKVSKDDMRHGLSLGADDYILKPFDPSAVLDIIKMRLNKRELLLKNPTSKPTINPKQFAFKRF